MQYYCEQSENSRLIVDRFIETCDGSDQLFLSGANGSEFLLIIKEYCHGKGIAPESIVSLDPSMLEDGVLGELIVMLRNSNASANVVVLRVNAHLSEVSENKLMKFLNNPVFNDSKLIVVMDGFDPFEDLNPYSATLSNRAKTSLFVLPPLKHRLADLAHFTVELLEDLQKSRNLDEPLFLSEGAMELLLSYDWPGNYDELVEVLRVLVYGSKRGGIVSRGRLEEVLNHGRTSPVE